MLGITTLFFLSHWTGLLYVSFLHSVTHLGLQDEGGSVNETYPNIMIICDYCGCSISIIMPGGSYTFSSVQALQVRAFVRIPTAFTCYCLGTVCSACIQYIRKWKHCMYVPVHSVLMCVCVN